MSTGAWTIQSSDLQTLLATVKPAIATKTVFPVLSGVRLSPDGELGILEAWATNVEIGIVARVPATVEKHDGIVASYDLLSTLSHRLNGVVSCSIAGGDLHVKTGSVNAKVRPAGEVDDMPNRPRSGESSVTILGSDLARAMNRTSFCIAKADVYSGGALEGMNIRIRKGEMVIVTADGHRAAFASVGPVPDGINWPDNGILIPRNAVNGLADLLRKLPAGSNVTISYGAQSPNAITVHPGEDDLDFAPWVFFTRLLDWTFPDLRHHIRETSDTTITVDAPLLREATKVAAIFGHKDERGDAPRIILSVDATSITALGTSAHKGDGSQSVDAIVSGPAIDRRIFDGNYLDDIIAAVGRPVVIGIDSDMRKPTIFRDSIGTDFWMIQSMIPKGF